MNLHDLLQLVAFSGVVLVLAWPLATYMAAIFSDAPNRVTNFLAPVERTIYFLTGIQADRPQDWKQYLGALIVFNAMGFGVLFLMVMHQDMLPWNPQNLPGVSVDLAFNIASAFITNTDWQSYSGETTLSYFSQMAGLTVQNFLSAATGFAVAIAFIRGFIRKENSNLGNFYVDITRVTVYLLLPLALLLAVFLVWQGSPQNMQSNVQVTTIEGAQQIIAEGPVASQVAIKMVGSNGGGYFNANSAHPYENPTPLSNFVEMISIVILAFAFVLAFGKMIGDRRQGKALLIVMSILFFTLFFICYYAESGGNPAFRVMGIDQMITDSNPGGNMEGKEIRFGILNSTLWASLTTATSNGSVNAMHDSFTPLGGLVPLFNMLVGEVIYGGVGCGLYGIIVYVLITVFVAGLMVGRTPEYLGKKIEAHEVKLAVITQLLYPLCVLGGGVIALLVPGGAKSLSTSGAHGITQMIYAYASAAANNGSAFAGLNANTIFQNVSLGLVMLIGRFGVIIPVMAIAGSLAAKKITPSSSGTFPTHGLMFMIMLFAVIVMFGGLTYFPVMALGPIAEHLSSFTHPTF